MWPDLGKYAVPVTSAYGVTIVLTLGLIAVSILQARKSRRRLEALEAKRHG